MAKAKKIKKEELQAVRDAVTNFNRAKTQLGDLEYQKSQLVSEVMQLEATLKIQQKSLEETYGPVTVNLETGEYEAIAEEAQLAE